MGWGYTISNLMLATREYRNWAEVIAATAKREEPAQLVLKNGLNITSTGNVCHQVREIFFEQVYTPPPLHIGHEDIVVDIGAHCGIFSLFAATYTKNRIYAFEPALNHFTMLQKNITYNQLTQIKARRCIIADKVGMIKATSQEEALPILTLGAIIEHYQLEQINFLKINCAGWEKTLLNAISLDDLQKIQQIALAFYEPSSVSSPREIQEQLWSAGFATLMAWNRATPRGYIYGWRVA